MRLRVKEGGYFHLIMLDDALREVEKGVIVRLLVVPGAATTGIAGFDPWKKRIRFKTKKQAEKNKANRSILEYFTSRFGREAIIVKGEKSREKEVLVLGVSLGDLLSKIKEEIK